jgi:hypothetical protein
MEAEVLKTVGQVAGVGGLALGVFLLLFRDIIRKNVFPQLTKQKAYELLRLISVLVFLVAIAGLGAWVWGTREGGDRIGGPGVINRGTVGGDVNVGGSPAGGTGARGEDAPDPRP